MGVTKYVNMQLSIVIDIGSSSIRCSSLNSQGATVSQVKIPHSLLQSNDARDILQLYGIVNEALNACIKQLYDIGKDFSILCIGFASFVMNFIALDLKTNLPLYCMHYGSRDVNIVTRCNHLKSISSEDEILEHYNVTGTMLIHPCYAFPHMHFLYSQGSCFSEQNVKWTTIASYIISQWTSDPPTISLSEAAWTGLLDVRNKCWISSSPAPVSHLPRIETQPTPTFLNPEFALKWPGLANTAIYHAIGDGYAANLGSASESHTSIAVTIGTSAAARILLPQYTPTPLYPGLWKYAVSMDEVLLGGSLTDGGSLLSWFRSIVGDERFEVSMQDLKENYSSVPSSHAAVPTTLPFFSGERSTGYHFAATGDISNITHATSASQLLRSLMEGVMFRLAEIIDSIMLTGDPVAEWCLVGSGQVLETEHLWRQMLADITGCTVLISSIDSSEVTTRGVWKYTQLCAQHYEPTCCQEVVISSITKPLMRMRAYYLEQRKRHKEAYKKSLNY